ncbi:MAG: 6-bladed beta-propeller [Candidatus Aminicenantes bacterium]|nr:MAG: 6-bladed beta-propeller [Candidatus Aminicenantes bacterium]
MYRLVVFLVMLVPYLSSQGAPPKRIFLEEVLTIGSFEDDSLFQWVGVVADDEENIYVTDAMDYSLKKFDAAGRFVAKSGRRGQGPGEFTAPRLLDCSEQFLFVTEQYQPVIKVFDKKLQYQYHIPLEGPAGDMKALRGGLLAVVVLSAKSESQLKFYDREGKIVKELHFQERPSLMLMDMVSFDLDGQGNIYLVYNFMDRIEKFDGSGKKIWSKNLLGLKQVKREKISSYMVPTEIVFKDVALDQSGNLYVLGGKFSQNRSRDVYVLSPEGILLSTLTLPETSHCIYIDRENYLYSRANEGITLKKFRMVSK